MQPPLPDPSNVLLSPQTVAHPAFPYDARLDHARRFLASRGITDVRPVYGARAKIRTLNARLASALDVRGASNDDAHVGAARDPSAA